MGKHDDIIHLGRPYDPVHKPMSIHNRAAQFAPFDALTGYSARIREATRTTTQKRVLGEDQRQQISQRLNLLQEKIEQHPLVTITYFVQDPTKDGGDYNTIEGTVFKVDDYSETVRLGDKTHIHFDDILSIEGEIFDEPVLMDY